ncbi:MAG: hypothetical protein L3J22_11700, partial [Xanthomonadales bacterium]|nr:hypothetical protein [Xanthomonadales bacterium]
SAGELPVLDMLIDNYIPASPYKLSQPFQGASYLRSKNTKAAQDLYSLVILPNQAAQESEVSPHILGAASAFGQCPSDSTEASWAGLVHEVAVMTISYLAVEENQALWQMTRWQGCQFNHPETELQLELYSALAAKNPQQIFQKALLLLEAESDKFTDNQNAFFVDAAMLGALAMEDPGRALEIEKKYATMVYLESNKQVHRRMLKAYAQSLK